MYFVVKSGNKQYLVQKGQEIIVDRLEVEEGNTVELPVLFTFGDEKGAKKVKAIVKKHQKGKKLRIFKYKAKSNYKRSYGHRSSETVLEIQ